VCTLIEQKRIELGRTLHRREDLVMELSWKISKDCHGEEKGLEPPPFEDAGGVGSSE